MINKDMKLSEIIKMYPAAVKIFNDQKIDFCCGGEDTLEVATEELGIDFNNIIDKIIKTSESYIKEDDDIALDLEKFRDLSIVDMIDNLLIAHHQKERNLLSEIDSSLNKILVVHYNSHKDQLISLHRLFGLLKIELEAHFAKEEKLVFPLILENPTPSKTILDDIKEIEKEHDVAGDIIKEIQDVTNNFNPPKDGCATYNLTFIKLKELIEDIFIHIHKENSILFKKYESN